MNHLSFAYLLTALLLSYPIASAQNASLEGPPLHPSSKDVGIDWQSRSSKWEVKSPPIFLREKAFEARSLPPDLKGRFLTTSNPGGDGKKHNFCVWSLKTVKPQGKDISQVSSTFYNGQEGWAFYAPLFSPNGRLVAGRWGYPPDDTTNTYDIYLWNLSTGQIRRPRLYMPSEVENGVPNPQTWTHFYPGLSWSPGSRYLSYVRGGDLVGGYFNRSGKPYSDKGYELWIYDVKANRYAHPIQANVGLSWSWTHHGSLLFSRVTNDDGEALRTRAGRPSVYEVGVNGGNPKKLFDGGYFATESPNGEWIAFVDWPGFLMEADQLVSNQSAADVQVEPGVYLFNRSTGRRIFAGALPDTPQMSVGLQWAPDSKTVFVLNTEEIEQKLVGALYRLDVEQPMRRLSTLPIERPLRTANTSSTNWFSFRGTSPDGKRLYANTTQYITNGPKEFVNDKHTMWCIDTESGVFTPIAMLMDIANENIDWDWHDDSGSNPAFEAAQKLEDALPVWAPAKSGTLSSKRKKTTSSGPIRGTARSKKTVTRAKRSSKCKS